MTWFLLAVLASVSGVVLLGLTHRRYARRVEVALFAERARARETGSDKARLQHPHVDLSQCIGCGACVRACPEEGVLELVHGQAAVVHGARCVGHGRCADACPADAITITLEGLEERRDIPALTDELEAVGRPGLFVAGELGGFALVRTALSQGSAVGAAVAGRRTHRRPRASDARLDLLVVGAGPAGLACALAARAAGLEFLVIDQADDVGGTVASYPRRKLVMTQPVDLPLGVRLAHLSYEKEHLVALWEQVVAEHELPVRTGVRLLGVERREDDAWLARTSVGDLAAANVCLALGRRGTPRKLGVPGEHLPKVAYSLLDAQSYRGRAILVVGGGDSAVEAALALAEQPGNEVAIAYRKAAFFRLKARNAHAVGSAIEGGRITAHFESEVDAIEPDAVLLRTPGGVERLRNDEVFVFAGGVAPFGLLEQAGVSFDPADRAPVVPLVDRGTGLLRALGAVFVCALAVIVWARTYSWYYDLRPALRPLSELHAWLGPRGTVGLWTGLVACGLFGCNLLYLVRRSLRIGAALPGKLTTWLASHVFTGFLAWLLIVVHAGLSPANTVGGHAFVALTVVVAAGAVGRYLYAWVPRAANGTEAALEELRSQVAALSGEWDRAGGGFAATVRDRVERLASHQRWGRGFFGRLAAIIGSRRALRRETASLRALGHREQIPANEVEHLLGLAKEVHRLAFMVNHYADLRGVLGTWRWIHRWLALLMIALVAVHVVNAVRFGEIDWSALLEGPP